MATRQIAILVPQVPSGGEGVGDHALNVARTLRASHDINSVFVPFHPANLRQIEGFEILRIEENSVAQIGACCDGMLLHYVNYAYQRRGVPFRLRNLARSLRPLLRGRWVTMFHELYASGPPWKSAFWLRPWQVSIARSFIELSDACFVSNLAIEREIHRHDAGKAVRLVPVMSNFGEPQVTGFDRSPHQWTVCGGSALLARSLDSLTRCIQLIPKWCAPERLNVIGGHDTPALRRALDALQTSEPHLTVHRFPDLTVPQASALLLENGFAWIDYFGSGRVWPGMIFKSSSFAACCAHGIIPVFSHSENDLGVDSDLLPGPFCIKQGKIELPDRGELPTVRRQIYRWYQRHASAAVTAAAYAEALS